MYTRSRPRADTALDRATIYFAPYTWPHCNIYLLLYVRLEYSQHTLHSCDQLPPSVARLIPQSQSSQLLFRDPDLPALAPIHTFDADYAPSLEMRSNCRVDEHHSFQRHMMIWSFALADGRWRGATCIGNGSVIRRGGSAPDV